MAVTQSTQPSSPAALWGTLLVLASAFLFALKAIVIKSAFAAVPAFDGVTLLALRMLTALPFYLLLVWYSPPPPQPLRRQDWGLLLLAGLLGYYLASILDFIGLQYISASLERLILFLYPTLTVLITAAVARQPVRPATRLAIVLSYGGTVLVMLGEGGQHLNPPGLWLGSALVFAAAVAYALYLVLTPTLIGRFGSLRLNGLSMSVACVAALLHFALHQSAPWQFLQHLPLVGWGYGLALGVFATVLPTVFLMMGIERIGPARAALLSSGGPILTLLLAVAILGERLNGLQWLGVALNLGGVMMVSLRRA